MVRVIFKYVLLCSILFQLTNANELFQDLEKNGFICGVQRESDVDFCKKHADNNKIEFYMKDNIVNVVAVKTINNNDTYDRNEIFTSLGQHCDKAFKDALQGGFKRAQDLLNLNIKKGNGVGIAYTATVYSESQGIDKTITVTSAEHKGKDDTEIGVICFISPSIVLY